MLTPEERERIKNPFVQMMPETIATLKQILVTYDRMLAGMLAPEVRARLVYNRERVSDLLENGVVKK